MKKYRFSFKCKMCGYSLKELCNCTLTFKEKTVNVPLCNRCMKRLGLKERENETEKKLVG
jgi:sulfur relay (sulfurtransferase) complex TusBCD TusD component (DsrE family)